MHMNSEWDGLLDALMSYVAYLVASRMVALKHANMMVMMYKSQEFLTVRSNVGGNCSLAAYDANDVPLVQTMAREP